MPPAVRFRIVHQGPQEPRWPGTDCAGSVKLTITTAAENATDRSAGSPERAA